MDPEVILKSIIEDFICIILEGSAYCKYVDFLVDSYISKNSMLPLQYGLILVQVYPEQQITNHFTYIL